MNRHLLRLACLALVVAMALRCNTGNLVDPDSSGTPPGQNPPPPAAPMASIRATVTSGDSLVIAMVSLTGAGITRTAWTVGLERAFTFDDLPPGVYTLTAAPVGFGFVCQSATADVNAGETVTTNIACEQSVGSIIGTVVVNGMALSGGAQVSLTGPGGSRTASTVANGTFAFAGLPPGAYTLRAYPNDLWLSCDSITVSVQAFQTATANISCVRLVGNIGGQVTINGEARPIVWVELQRVSDGFPWAYGTTIPSGSWEFREVPAGDYVVVIKTPPGLTCDATSKSATVRQDQATIVNFACVGDVKGLIQGFTSNEFGTFASARVILTGPVNQETSSNADGFFAFEDLPPGDYVVSLCSQSKTVTVQQEATAFVNLDCS